MAEQIVRIDSSAAFPIFTQPPTAITGSIYTTLIQNTLSVNTANNYLSLFNPLGSGKNLMIAQFTAFPYATAAQATTINMEVQRISAASGGALLAAANINKFLTSQGNSIAEVRTGNPTVTLVGTIPIVAIPPALTTAANGVSSPANIIPPSGSLFTCVPGEGVVVKQLAGAGTTQVWSLGFSWAEI